MRFYSFSLHKKCKYAAYLELCYVLVLALTLSKNNSEVLRNNVIDHMKQVRFISIMSDDSRPLTDQEAILLRKVHPDTHEPANVFASIKCLKRNRTSRILYGQVTFFR